MAAENRTVDDLACDCEHGYRAAGGNYDCPACEVSDALGRVDHAAGYLREACRQVKRRIPVEEFDRRVSEAARLIAGEGA